MYNCYITIEVTNDVPTTVDNILNKKCERYVFTVDSDGNTVINAVNHAIRQIGNQISKWDVEDVKQGKDSKRP